MPENSDEQTFLPLMASNPLQSWHNVIVYSFSRTNWLGDITMRMDALFITGSWEGALRSDQDGPSVPFSLRQSALDVAKESGPQFRIGNGGTSSARLLDAAPRALVALVDAGQDARAEMAGQWLVDARLRNDQLVGYWVHRDTDGHVLGTGQLSAERIGRV